MRHRHMSDKVPPQLAGMGTSLPNTVCPHDVLGRPQAPVGDTVGSQTAGWLLVAPSGLRLAGAYGPVIGGEPGCGPRSRSCLSLTPSLLPLKHVHTGGSPNPLDRLVHKVMSSTQRAYRLTRSTFYQHFVESPPHPSAGQPW